MARAAGHDVRLHIRATAERARNGNHCHEDRSGATRTEWGSWAAEPGSRFVEGPNVLKISTPTNVHTVIVRLTSNATGTDASWSIPLEGNLQFASWQPASGSPCGPTPAAAWSARTSAEARVATPTQRQRERERGQQAV